MGIKCGLVYKIVELILAILGTVCYVLMQPKLGEYHYHFDVIDRPTEQCVAVCMVNAIATVVVQLVCLVKGKPSKVLELCLTGAVGLMNLGVGALLFCTLGNSDRSAKYIILAGLCIGFGVVLIIDVLRIIKGIND